MSKSVASESLDHNESRETNGKKGLENEENEDEEGILEIPPAECLTISTTVSTAPAATDDFMHTVKFKNLFVSFVHEQTLMALSVLNKEWNGVADALIDKGVRSGELMVHDGKDVRKEANPPHAANSNKSKQ
ncbi:hypothetical protein TL16_g01144 [Triparma laevis f. inornata]|uniref:Uncharacterized protein n=1 Tax=Triparma laevis f. inornata TaxID=1714386 RepID=A0A9W6ZGW3_9STRA|nr:hypothetical protein TL16_g01144 [Triparma laevis f. inornata]